MIFLLAAPSAERLCRDPCADDVQNLLPAPSSWRVVEAKDGLLTRLREVDAPKADVNSLWCRPADATNGSFELMLDESEGDRWVFRRDRTIQRPLWLTVRRDPSGIPLPRAADPTSV